MAKNDGGSAFPCPTSEMNYLNQQGAPFQSGITMRDYFAAAALQGIVAQSGMADLIEKNGPAVYSAIATGAYNFADAMLAEREK